nr:MAG TPA: crossover junction endodeoxyribonuclease [Caudoviricetes sp.]
MTGTQELVIKIHANEWISANDRMHWRERASRTKRLRRKAYFAARQNWLFPMRRVFLIAHVQYATNGRADPANAYPTVKALVDGLTDFGVLTDDDSKHLPAMTFKRAPGRCSKGWHVITLTLVEEDKTKEGGNDVGKN